MRRALGLALAFGVVVLLAALAFVRLAPADPAVWHLDLAKAEAALPRNAHVFCIRPDNRYGPVQGDPSALLARLDTIAMATPRTKRLAGSVAEGQITWVTRSALIGFPDFTTAQVMAGPGLCLLGRNRFGGGDMGVNAARVGGWAKDLLGLAEMPGMTGF